jgi:hypothetical protein
MSSNGSSGRRIGAFKPVRAAPMDAERAEAAAAAALLTLTETPERLSRFMRETGLTATDLAERAGHRDLLAAVLEHVLSDESLLLVVATTQRVTPDRLQLALQLLQGPMAE